MNLKDTRSADGATLLDDYGHFYRLNQDGSKAYGYRGWLTGAWICYTDGAYCACHEFCDCHPYDESEVA